MDATSTDQNPSSGERPEVIVAIVFGSLFGVLLVVVSLMVFVFFTKYRNLKHSLEQQNHPNQSDKQSVIKGISNDTSITDPAVNSNYVHGGTDVNAITKQNYHSQSMQGRSNVNEPNVVSYSDNTDDIVNDTHANGQNANDIACANEQQYTPTQFGESAQTTNVFNQVTLEQTSVNESRKSCLRSGKEPNFTHSEKIGLSKKRYIERLLGRMRRNSDSSIDRPGAFKNQAGEQQSTGMRRDSETSLSQLTSIDQIQQTGHNGISRDSEDADPSGGEEGVDSTQTDTHSTRPQGEDYMNKLLEQLRKDEQKKESHYEFPRKRLFKGSSVDDEMLRFHQSSFEYLSRDQSNQRRQKYSASFHKSLQESSKRRLDRLPSVHSDEASIDEEH